ncbi:unnamed protein product [Clavelina lepadiformis]|uniref:Zinc finger PHD-type domain-containing protein n=1 Tax=Clavelina lepadiformis TaxID=159417 RepID=A0ABP0EV06_CLALP
MFPLNTFYSQEIEKFLRDNPGRVVTQFQIGRLFGNAYIHAATANAAGLPEMPESLPAQPIDVAQPSSPEDANSSFTIISPVELLPMPKAAHTLRKRKSKRGATAILTSSPYKKQLAATNRSQSAVSGNSSKTSSSKKRSMKKAKVSRSSMQQKDTVDKSDNNVDAECFYCNEMYSKSSENDGWIQCSKCMRWAHEACSGCNEEDDNFICELCF